MRAHELIRKTREQAGLSNIEVAARAGMSVAEYDDVEQHPDEFVSALSLTRAKAVCATLHLKLMDLVILELGDVGESRSVPPELGALQRNLLLRKRREAFGMSESALADGIGFEAAAIQRVEADDGFLETLPIRVLADLATELQLPVGRLVM
jgi:transcriptional regulator with XRE-family HTH domain